MLGGGNNQYQITINADIDSIMGQPAGVTSQGKTASWRDAGYRCPEHVVNKQTQR